MSQDSGSWWVLPGYRPNLREKKTGSGSSWDFDHDHPAIKTFLTRVKLSKTIEDEGIFIVYESGISFGHGGSAKAN